MKALLRTSVLVAALYGARGTASAGTITVFGIPLGEPLSLPQCAQELPISVSATCWTYDAPTVDSSLRTLHFPNPPVWASEVSAIVDSGVVAFVTIQTGGVSNQDDVMAELRSKFGEPTKFQKIEAQNRMGARYIVDRAVWDSPQYFVRFDADGSDGGTHDGNIDEGWVSIATQSAHQRENERHEKYLESRQPF